MSTEGEIIINDDAQGEQKAIRISDIPRSVMQAIYYEATQKTEKITRSFNSSYKFKFHDVENIIEIIKQTSEQYSITGNSEIIIINHEEGDKIRYSSFLKFKEYNTNTTKPIDSITIQWKFLLSVPLVGLHHEYQINVKLDSYIMSDGPEHDFRMMFLEELAFPGIIVSVDYVDYVVARSFLSSIEDWEKSIEREVKNKFITSIMKQRRYINTFTPPIAALAAISGSVGIWHISRLISKPDFQLQSWMVGEGAFIFLSFYISKFILHITLNKVLGYNCPIILINKGDERNYNKIREAVARGPRRLLTALSVSAVQILLNLASSAIFKAIAK
jgi:hypothetical protein